MATLTYEDLYRLQPEMEDLARSFGLDFPKVRYEIINWKTMSQVAAMAGFPVRYPHWSWGMEYNRLAHSYSYGLHRIYEIVLNSDPTIAYLLSSNLWVDQKLVILHVCGHAHFMKHNMWFAHTNRRMDLEMANHATRVWKYIEKHGFDEVESFLDTCLSLENLIDMHSVAIRRKPLESGEDEPFTPSRLPAKGYMDEFVNPRWRTQMEQEADKHRRKEEKKKFPLIPEQDILLFLLEHARLDSWQLDILDMIREEAYYFAPQAQTKIMNEGFAAFIHSRLMTGGSGSLTPALDAAELIDYAAHHAGVVGKGRNRLNPYRLGLMIFKDIEDRWDRGAFGNDWEECTNLRERKEWDKKLGLGLQKVFDVATLYNDINFIDEFLTPEIVDKEELFSHRYDKETQYYVIDSREFDAIKRRLLFGLTNRGQPIIEVTNGNYDNRRELLLEHRYQGVGLDYIRAEETLKCLFRLWTRPVHLITTIPEYDEDGNIVSERKVRLTCKGEDQEVEETELK